MKLIDKTPPALRCTPPYCPSVHKDEDTGQLYIVGKRSDVTHPDIRVGPDECLIVVDSALLEHIND